MDNKFRNCFAYGENECSALTEMLCKTKGKCRFYKTQKQYDKEQLYYHWKKQIERVKNVK